MGAPGKLRGSPTGARAMRSVRFRRLLASSVAMLLPGLAGAQVELRGRVVGETGAPIGGATITLRSIGYSVRADSLGEFRIAGQPGSTLALSLRAEGYRDDTASVTLGRGRGTLTRDFTLVAADAPLPEPNPSDRLLRGRVQDESGQSLSYANVQVNFGRRYMSDDSGRFQIPWSMASATLLVRRIGFEPAELRVTELPDTAVRILMKPIPVQLKGVVVTGASPFRSLDLYGFYTRMKDAERGINHGYFITPEDFERRKPNWVTQMAEGFPTVRVCATVSMTCPTRDPMADKILGSRACLMTVYLDNIRIVGKLGGQDDLVNAIVKPSHAAAMEIYPRAVDAPPQYQPMNGSCGVVLIWTK